MKRILIAAILGACVAGAPLTLSAADAPAEKPAQGNKAARPKFRPFRGTIKSFDKVAKSITLQGEKGDTILVTSQTKVWKDGKPATTEEITAGELVRGAAKEGAEGKWEAMSVYLGQPPARKAPSKSKDGEKKTQ